MRIVGAADMDYLKVSNKHLALWLVPPGHAGDWTWTVEDETGQCLEETEKPMEAMRLQLGLDLLSRVSEEI